MSRKKVVLMAMFFVMMMASLAPAETIRWIGASTAVAEVDTFTPANVEIDDIFTLTVTGLDGTTFAVNFTATDTTVANVTAGIEAAWNASTNVLTTPMTATDNTTTISLAADTAGDEFSVASTETDGGGNDTQTFTRAATTASSGPKHWDTAANWSGGAVPGGAGSQDVFVEDFPGDILFGLDQSGIANTLDSLNFGKSFTGAIASNGSAGITAAYLQIKATLVTIGQHFGPGTPIGSGRIKLDLGSIASTVTVDGTGTAIDTSKPSVRLLLNSATANLIVNKGNVGLAIEAGETSTLGTCRVEFVTNVTADADMFLGDAVTFGGTNSLTITGGQTTLRTAVTTITQSGGELNVFGSGATTTFTVTGGRCATRSSGNITTLKVQGGVFTADSIGTIGTATISDGDVELNDVGNITTITASGGTLEYSGTGTTVGTLTASGATIFPEATGDLTALTITGGTVDFTTSTAARTVTTPKLDAGGQLKYDPAIITMTNKIDSDNPVTLTASN